MTGALTRGDFVCGACGLNFASLTLFDWHRIGKHEYTLTEGLRMDPAREDGRRCRTVDEIQAAGYALNERGRWYDVQEARRARMAFGTSQTG
jgi:hypothetical protein